VNVLTVDLGTSATKAALWSGNELVELARVPIPTSHPAPNHAEQDPEDWWNSVVDACALVRDEDRSEYDTVEVVGFAAARETFACFDQALAPIGPGILWSDARATTEVASFGDAGEFRRRTGVVLNPGCCAAKVAWVRAHEPARFETARWLLAPRDLVVARLSGGVRTDPTLASRTGFYALDGTLTGDPELTRRLPPVRPSTELLGLHRADQLGLASGILAILGAGDRPCETLGVGASPSRPMVSWGTTASVCAPHLGPISALPTVAQVSRHISEPFLIESGLSAAGAAMGWLERLTGWTSLDLVRAAATVTPGAEGLLAFPWLHGARAPWWRSDVQAAFVGTTAAHGPPEFARAVIEGIALDVARCVEQFAPDARILAVAGRGAGDQLWRSLLAAVSGLPVVRHAIDDGASVGARLLVAEALGQPLAPQALNPLADETVADAALRDIYRKVRRHSDQAAEALLGVGVPGPGDE
jgi:sugar (pentulose or hexulose) kinase